MQHCAFVIAISGPALHRTAANPSVMVTTHGINQFRIATEGCGPIRHRSCSVAGGKPPLGTRDLHVTAGETDKDESCSVVNPNLRARPGAVHFALGECRPSCHFIFKALSS